MAANDPPESDDTLPPLADPTDVGLSEESDNSEPADTEEATEELNLEVAIEQRSACERHITLTIPREDIDRYYEKEFSELVTSAQVPGFRPGRAPRKLIEARFRKDVTDKVKTELLMDSIAQVNEREDLSAIGEPDFDVEAVELPDEGPMTFEFDLEVRPQFDLPQWRGLKIKKPVREFTEADVDQALESVLARYGKLVPYDGPAEVGDYVSTNLTFKHGDEVLSRASEEVIRIRPVLSFRDGNIEKFDELLVGVRAGETRQGEAVLTDDAPNPAMRGMTVSAVFEVLEVKKLVLPELTPAFLAEMGGFESEAELRDLVRDNLRRRLEYHQRRTAREQITAALTVSAKWELPPDLLKRQSDRELSRAILELRRSGFSEQEIRARENELRQTSRESTARALKEHFILERIAEEEQIEDTPEDYEAEIALIAMQSGESPRRVRARLEKSGQMDSLRNQIVERKVIDLILAEATFEEVAYFEEDSQAEAIDRAAGGGEPESDIPEAIPEGSERKQGGQSES